jgi:GNAT superfamily N-acetyltransferase
VDEGIGLRRATEDDLAVCAEIHRRALADYLVPAGQQLATWQPAALIRLFAHIRSTDPGRFLVAERSGEAVGFASAWVRGGVWFLAMLFVLPDEQGRGLGARLLEAVLPGPDERAPDGERFVLAVATDSIQPVSNALYAHYGMVPRMPVFLMRGPASRPDAFPPLPSRLVVTPFTTTDAPADATGSDLRADVTIAVDREVLGFVRPVDHRWLATDRRGVLVTDADGEPVGYGYVREDGRLGPVAAMDASLVPAILGELIRMTPAPEGGFSLVAPGAAAGAFTACLAAGMRLVEPPTLFGWDRPYADFSRYVPINNALS